MKKLEMTDLYLSTTQFGIQSKMKCMKQEPGESSPEVSSSCGRLSGGDVDLDLWDLDVSAGRSHILHGHGGVLVRSINTFSETSSISGTRVNKVKRTNVIQLQEKAFGVAQRTTIFYTHYQIVF